VGRRSILFFVAGKSGEVSGRSGTRLRQGEKKKTFLWKKDRSDSGPDFVDWKILRRAGLAPKWGHLSWGTGARGTRKMKGSKV